MRGQISLPCIQRQRSISTDLFRQSKSVEKKPEIAINPGTPVSMIKEILPMADLVLCMTTNPGVFGESFIPSVADKVKNLCELREQKDILIRFR